MKKAMTGTVVLILLAAFFAGSFKRGVRALAELPSSTAVTHALDTTVRIVMYAPQPANNGTYLVEYGLGTLVNQDTQTVIITHDHWKDVLARVEIVQFWNGRNQLITELSGDLFLNQILYRDRGTMILLAPPAMYGLTTAVLGNPTDVQIGDTVQVMHQEHALEPERATLELHDAIVTEITTFDGQPSFTLRSLDGKTIVQGDSGGGIWHNGRLVGNMWATMTGPNWQVWNWESLDDAVTETDQSFAAVHPAQADSNQWGTVENMVQRHQLLP